MSLLTAWQFLVALGHDVPNPLQPNPHAAVPLKGKTVLVNGAAGGVGHFALQVAKLQGARVIAVASGRHEAFLRGLGADEVIDYGTIRVAIDSTFTLADARQAHERAAKGHIRGKIVLTAA